MTESELFETLGRVSVDSAWTGLAALGFSDTFIPVRSDLVETLRLRERGLGNQVGPKNTKPGDVLVIDACDVNNGGAFGDILVAGFRAPKEVWALAPCATLLPSVKWTFLFTPPPLTPLEAGACVDVNVPVNCAGVTVVPGDIVLGDAEGVLIISSYLAERVALDAVALEDKENFLRGKIERGEASVEEAYPMSPRLQAECAALKKNSSP